MKICQLSLVNFQKRQTESGFTLLEVVISLGIVLFVLGAFIAIQILVRQSYLFTFNSSVTIEHANSGVAQIIKAVRGVRPGDNGAFALEILNDQELAFFTDIDGDNQTERVRYFLDGTELKQGVIKPSGFPIGYPSENEVVKIISQYIQNGTEPVFYYFNDAWPEDITNNPLIQADRLSDTRFIQVSLTVNTDPGRPQANYQLSPTVALRNLKDNL